MASNLLSFKLESREGTTIYNLSAVMRQFNYDQDVITLIGELYTSSAWVAEARFIGYGESQIMASKKKSVAPSWPM